MWSRTLKILDPVQATLQAIEKENVIKKQNSMVSKMARFIRRSYHGKGQ